LKSFPLSLENIHNLLEVMFECDKKALMEQLNGLNNSNESKWFTNIKLESTSSPLSKREDFFLQNLTPIKTVDKNNWFGESHIYVDDNNIPSYDENERKKAEKTPKHCKSLSRDFRSQKKLTSFNPFLALKNININEISRQTKIEKDQETSIVTYKKNVNF